MMPKSRSPVKPQIHSQKPPIRNPQILSPNCKKIDQAVFTKQFESVKLSQSANKKQSNFDATHRELINSILEVCKDSGIESKSFIENLIILL